MLLSPLKLIPMQTLILPITSWLAEGGNLSLTDVLHSSKLYYIVILQGSKRGEK